MSAAIDKPAYLAWFLAGFLQVLVFQALAVEGSSTGNWAVLLQVGSEKPFQHRIQQELGPVPIRHPLGHDGEMEYVIARDPLGNDGVPELLMKCDNPQYRYRRIVFPLLAGGFGQFGPWLTVYAMSFWIAVGNGLVMVAVADLARQWRLGRWSILLAWINIGILICAFCMTMDTLGLGLALGGVTLWLRRRHRWSLAAFVLAALTKEVLLFVPWAMAAWSLHDRRVRDALWLAVTPTAAVGVWSLWLLYALPRGPAATHNFTLPFNGIRNTFEYLTTVSPDNEAGWLLFVTALGMLGAAAATLLASSNRLLNWLSLPWIGLGVIASDAIWINNAVRVLLPLWPLMALNLGWLLRPPAPQEMFDGRDPIEETTNVLVEV